MDRRIAPEVYRAEQRLRVVTAAATRDADTTIAALARAHGCSPAQVYKHLRKTRDVLIEEMDRA